MVMDGSMSRAAKAAMGVALQDPWSKAPALGVPTAKGMASKGGRASACSLGGLDRVWAPIKQRSCATAAWAWSCGAQPSVLLLCMRRDSGSVQLAWSLSRGPGGGGVGGRPRGVDPVGRALAARSRTVAS